MVVIATTELWKPTTTGPSSGLRNRGCDCRPGGFHSPYTASWDFVHSASWIKQTTPGDGAEQNPNA